MPDTSHNLTPADWNAAQRVLQAVLKDPALADERPEFRSLVAGVNRLGRKHARQQQAEAKAQEAAQATSKRVCYMCRQKFAEADPENPALCRDCGDLSRVKRAARADLSGRVAILTGGRIKIGYATSLRLLRDGATVIVTTRFPQDALRRYQAEPDAGEWLSRLHLYGLDLRDLRGIHAFCDWVRRTQPHLDILITTPRRPSPARCTFTRICSKASGWPCQAAQTQQLWPKVRRCTGFRSKTTDWRTISPQANWTNLASSLTCAPTTVGHSS